MRRLLIFAVAVAGACKGSSSAPVPTEGGVRTQLGSLRSAVSTYYGDHDGHYPASLDEVVPKYLAAMPEADLPDHGKSAAVRVVAERADGEISAYVKDEGGWLYFSGPGRLSGAVVANCRHEDKNGKPRYSY